MTKDEEVLVAHDSDFDRLFKMGSYNRDKNSIHETKLADLPTFKDSLPLDFSNGLCYNKK